MVVTRTSQRLVFLSATMMGLGCGDLSSLGQLPGDSGGIILPDTDSAETDPDDEGPSHGAQGVEEDFPVDVDILFVVDNSMSMEAWIQEDGLVNLVDPLAANFERLRREGRWSSYRVAVTTTDMGNPACSLTTPEKGAFVWESCRNRRRDFYDGNGTADVSYAGCFAHCPADGISGIEPHPWLHVESQDSDLSEDFVRNSLRCMIPQGIAGCEFSSPLAATMRALQRMEDPKDPAHGFQRDDAHLVVIIVSNTFDCSHRGLAASMFEPGGNRVFWSDPSASRPTPAVCWNAGVVCQPSFGGGLVCAPQNRDLQGVPADRESAVLVPVQDYIEVLRSLQERKRAQRADVWLLGINGVTERFEAGEDLWCDAASDPETLLEFGIGPSCIRSEMEQVRGFSPVRVHAVADALHPDADVLSSICESDHGSVIDEVVAATAAMAAPANCLSFCVADTETDFGLQPDCFVHENTGVKPFEPIQECSYWCNDTPCPAAAANRWDYPRGSDKCYHALVDGNRETASDLDDMEGICRDRGSNMQIVIKRKNRAEGGGQVHVVCALSSQPDVDCPLLP